MTETDIGRLFIAGVLPGLLGIAFYLVAVVITVRLNPAAGPPGERVAWPERLVALRGVWGVLLLFFIVIGGIYGGVFTPTEAAGIGASGAFFFALLRGRLHWQELVAILIESARTTAMIFTILIGALVFSNYINIAGMPSELGDLVNSYGLSPLMVMLFIILIYVILGCVLESMSMILLTVPVFYPLVLTLDFGTLMDPDLVLIWFGIVIVVVTEISLITPPVGLNVFVLNGMLPDVKLSTIFKGVTPFWMVDIVRLVLLVLVPSVSLWLPSLMG
jgi:tripartite ATP-independent transporter DctM subunit